MTTSIPSSVSKYTNSFHITSSYWSEKLHENNHFFIMETKQNLQIFVKWKCELIINACNTTALQMVHS